MGWEKAFHEILVAELASRREKNPRYSLRAYARDLAVAPATLSELLREKTRWKLGTDRAQDMVARMNLTPSKQRRLSALMGALSRSERQELSEQDFDLLTDWKPSAIFFAHSLPVPMRAPEKLSARFGIALKDVEEICASLCARGLLHKTESGHLESTRANWCAEKRPPAEIVRSHHRAGLRRAVQAIEGVPVAERDLSALTFVGSLCNMDEIRKEIRSFHERIRDLMNRGDENGEVIQLSVALFPVRMQEEYGV